MAGINTLQEIYEKRGEEWTREFLSSSVVTEKVDAYRFSFEISRNGKLRYFGKNGEEPLNRIDRTVSDLYENAISKIEKLPEAILINLPKSHRFGFNWIPSEGLTLTDITLRQHGKVVKQLQEKEIVGKWAGLLHVNTAKTLEGQLDQVDTLIESLKTGKGVFEGWDPSKTYILKSPTGIAKIAPKDLRPARQAKSHTFDLLLFQMYEHIDSLDLERFSFRSERPDERYIEIVCEAFNHFVKDKGKEFMEMGVKKPAFLEKSGRFNTRWIRNEKTLAILENSTYEYLLSIFLTNLRKPKKAIGLLSESFVGKYNSKINQIDEIVRSKDDYGFPEFNTILEREDREVEAPKESEGFSDNEHLRAVGMMQTFFARPFANTNEDKDEVVHECNVLLINMGQFTNRLLNECERILKESGKSFALIHDENAGRSCLWGMSPEHGKTAAQLIVKEYPHVFDYCDSMSNPNLESINKRIGERKAVRVFSGRPVDALQKEHEVWTVIGGNIGELEISQIKGNLDKEIADSVETGNTVKFKEIFPETLHNFWNTMQSSWLSKAYH